jgi:hypothetical protein
MGHVLGKLALSAASILASIFVVGQPMAAHAGPFELFVGYADSLRPNGFFPNPWAGSPGVTFLGSGVFDSGAIRIQNTSASNLTIDDVSVVDDGLSFGDIWSASFPLTIAPGANLILAQNNGENFDTSDGPGVPGSSLLHPALGCVLITCPKVTITVNGGGPLTLLDTTHTLDTEGFDFVTVGNESFDWRLIGSCSGPGCGAVPLPATLPLLAGALGGLGIVSRWRKRRAASTV